MSECRCGSEEEAYWEYDTRGIPLCKCCSKCKDTQLAQYRPEVLLDSNYEADEQIEED